MITLITPTGDRPQALNLCKRWMDNQTVQGFQHVIVDDGHDPYCPPLAASDTYVRREPQRGEGHTLILNLKAALPHIKGDKIAIIEDDEYYAPTYVETMAGHLDHHEVVGITFAKYYHISGRHLRNVNDKHASLAQTAFRASFLPRLATLLDGDVFLDIRIWQAVNGGGYLFRDDPDSLYCGMKGLPGRRGIGAGHNTACPSYLTDKNALKLREWIPLDYQIYLNLRRTT